MTFEVILQFVKKNAPFINESARKKKAKIPESLSFVCEI
jgi:hypothetical protein